MPCAERALRCALVQIADQRAGAQRVEPVQKLLQLVIYNGLHLADFRFALLPVGCDDLFQVVDVEEKDIVYIACGGIDVARHGDVDEKKRATAALIHGLAQVLSSDYIVGGSGRGDDDIDGGELCRQRVERYGFASEASGQLLGSRQGYRLIRSEAR